MQQEPTKELKEIIDRFESAQKEGKTLYLDSEQYMEVADWYMHNKRMEDVYSTLNTAIEIHPDDSSLIRLYSTMLITNEELVKARSLLERLSDEKDTFEMKLLYIDLLMHEGKKEKAEDILDALSVQELDEENCIDLACVCLNIQYYEEGIKWAKRALKYNENNEEALSLICECHGGTKDFHKVIKVANRLLDINPYSAVYWSELAKAYYNLRQFDKAIEACDFAIVADKNYEDPYELKGHIYYQLKNYQASLEGYTKTWELSEHTDENAMIFTSYCLVALERWQEAYDAILKVREIADPSSHMYDYLYVNAALCLRMMNRREEAHKELEKCIAINSFLIEARLKNGQYYLEEENAEKAMYYFNLAAEIDESPEIWDEIGNIALECKEYEIARDAFRTVLEMDPEYEGVESKLYRISEMLEKEEEENPSLKYYIDMLDKITDPASADQYTQIDEVIHKALDEDMTPEDMKRLKESMLRVNEMLDLLKEAGEKDEDEESAE